VCTLVIAWQVFDGAPVVVAANRDEATDRPSTPPTPRGGSPIVVAPRDERAGGTWIGYNDAGVFVGISNRWVGGDVGGERSRGLLVADALEREDADSAVSSVEDALASGEYAPFNLVVVDAEAAVLLEWDGRLSITEFEPGVHVLTNAGYDDTFYAVPERPEAAAAQAESAARVRSALAPVESESPEAWLDRAADVLGDHDYGVCVHGDVSERRSDGQPDADASGAGYGTKSCSLVALRTEGPATYRFADGPPCTTPFEPVAADVVERDGPAEGQS